MNRSVKNVTTKRKSKMIGWIALGVTLTILALIAMRIDDWGRDCNQNFASLQANSDREGLRPVRLNCSVGEAESRIMRWTESSPRWEFVSPSEGVGDTRVMNLTRTTAIMKFVDDVEVKITANSDGNGVTITATSQSRIGKGDLGQNPRNLIELTTALRGG